MDSKKLIALEKMIYDFVAVQFQANGTSPLEARFVMQSVMQKISDQCISNLIMEAVSIEKPETEKHTGTPEDLIEAFKKTGFKPEKEGS